MASETHMPLMQVGTIVGMGRPHILAQHINNFNLLGMPYDILMS